MEREKEFDVAEAGSFADVVAAVGRECPDIALLDLDLLPVGGVGAVKQLFGGASTYVIVWSFDPTGEMVLDALASGAHGFLHKEISPAGLVRALRGVGRGEAPLSRDLASLLIDALHGLDERQRAKDRLTALSSREREVLEYVADGARNKEIAAALTISEFTAKRHVQNILQKLDLPSRRAAAGFYRTAIGVPEATRAAPQPA